jgi:hypothetical protein
LALTGITALVSTVGFPLVAVIRNNEAEYQATGDVAALFGHPFERLAHALGFSKVEVASLDTSNRQYAQLVAKFPNLRLDPDDSPEVRELKISAINSQWKTFAQLEFSASNENEAQIRKQLFAITNDPRTLKDDPHTPGIGYRPTAEDVKRLYPGDFDSLEPKDWDRLLPKPDQPAAVQLAAAEALGTFIKTSITAEEQARAETDINAPAISRARVRAMNADRDTHIRISERYSINRPITFYSIGHTNSPPPSIATIFLLNTQFADETNPFEYALQSTPEIIPIDQYITPLFSDQGALISYKNYVAIWDGDEWGLVPLDQYRSLRLPEKDNIQ